MDRLLFSIAQPCCQPDPGSRIRQSFFSDLSLNVDNLIIISLPRHLYPCIRHFGNKVKVIPYFIQTFIFPKDQFFQFFSCIRK